MSTLPTARVLDYPKTGTSVNMGLMITKVEKHLDSKNRVTRAKPERITETEYLEKYYNNPDTIYEWNNGILEEKTMSDKKTTSMHGWFFELIGLFLETYPIADRIFLETAFRLDLPHKTTFRKPDLGIVLFDNPVAYEFDDNTYHGICDLCVEALSDSSAVERIRDTETKFKEYMAAGVKEYYILYSRGEPMEFYRLNRAGVYAPIRRFKGGVIKSKVLPGFQFRISDLYVQPSRDEMAFDPVYKKFVLPYYQEERKKAQAEKQARLKAERFAQKEARRAETETRRADVAVEQAIEETKARQAAEMRIKRLEAELARLGKR